jgi:hypothetical protein
MNDEPNRPRETGPVVGLVAVVVALTIMLII